MFKLIKSHQPLQVQNINILIYGEPGCGKTSLGNTAKNPITLDCDHGAYRSNFRKDVIEIEEWREIVKEINQLFDFFRNYDTIIIDTVDTFLDYLGAYLIQIEPRLLQNKLKYFGRLQEEFTLFINNIRTLKKDLVLIAHVKERDEGDLRIRRPAITGGSYHRVVQLTDLVGYLYINNNKRILNFNPSDYWIGKNCANFTALEIPDFNLESNFLSSIIEQTKTFINNRIIKQNNAAEYVQKITEKANSLQTVTDFNDYLISLLAQNIPLPKNQIWNILLNAASNKGISYNKEKKQFVVKN